MLGGWLFVVIPLLIAIGFFTVGRTLSQLGGWRGLSTAYPDHPDCELQDRLSFQSLALQRRDAWFPCNYNNAVTIEVCRTGLRLRLTIRFAGGHPPFCVPWEDIDFGKPKRYWLSTVVPVTFRGQPDTTLLLSTRQSDRIVAAAESIAAIWPDTAS